MCAPSRALSQLPNLLLPYIYSHGDHFSVPGLDKLGSYRIVVSTCVSASTLFCIGIPPGHYTHIFVDEAGQATEPEVMVPIATMAGDLTNVVLSGDPKQLGPIIRSSVARTLGLEKSYLERIMEREGYDEDTGPHESYVHLRPFCYFVMLIFWPFQSGQTRPKLPLSSLYSLLPLAKVLQIRAHPVWQPRSHPLLHWFLSSRQQRLPYCILCNCWEGREGGIISKFLQYR
jgi:hypothetical protein